MFCPPFWLFPRLRRCLFRPRARRLDDRCRTWPADLRAHQRRGRCGLSAIRIASLGQRPTARSWFALYKDAAPDMVVVLAKSGEQARLPVNNGIAAQCIG